MICMLMSVSTHMETALHLSRLKLSFLYDYKFHHQHLLVTSIERLPNSVYM